MIKDYDQAIQQIASRHDATNAGAAGLTGRENVQLFGALYSIPKEALGARIDKIMEKVGLLDEAGRRAGKYSGGMKRRVSIAMALVHDPKIILLDEPTVGMDPQSRRAIWDFIMELRDRGK